MTYTEIFQREKLIALKNRLVEESVHDYNTSCIEETKIEALKYLERAKMKQEFVKELDSIIYLK